MSKGNACDVKNTSSELDKMLQNALKQAMRKINALESIFPVNSKCTKKELQEAFRWELTRFIRSEFKDFLGANINESDICGKLQPSFNELLKHMLKQDLNAADRASAIKDIDDLVKKDGGKVVEADNSASYWCGFADTALSTTKLIFIGGLKQTQKDYKGTPVDYLINYFLPDENAEPKVDA